MVMITSLEPLTRCHLKLGIFISHFLVLSVSYVMFFHPRMSSPRPAERLGLRERDASVRLSVLIRRWREREGLARPLAIFNLYIIIPV